MTIGAFASVPLEWPPTVMTVVTVAMTTAAAIPPTIQGRRPLSRLLPDPPAGVSVGGGTSTAGVADVSALGRSDSLGVGSRRAALHRWHRIVPLGLPRFHTIGSAFAVVPSLRILLKITRANVRLTGRGPASAQWQSVRVVKLASCQLDDVDQPPDPESATGQQLHDPEPELSEVEAVDPQQAGQDREKQGDLSFACGESSGYLSGREPGGALIAPDLCFGADLSRAGHALEVGDGEWSAFDAHAEHVELCGRMPSWWHGGHGWRAWP